MSKVNTVKKLGGITNPYSGNVIGNFNESLQVNSEILQEIIYNYFPMFSAQAPSTLDNYTHKDKISNKKDIKETQQ